MCALYSWLYKNKGRGASEHGILWTVYCFYGWLSRWRSFYFIIRPKWCHWLALVITTKMTNLSTQVTLFFITTVAPYTMIAFFLMWRESEIDLIHSTTSSFSRTFCGVLTGLFWFWCQSRYKVITLLSKLHRSNLTCIGTMLWWSKLVSSITASIYCAQKCRELLSRISVQFLLYWVRCNALAEHDLKRLLAWHTVENIGIIYRKL